MKITYTEGTGSYLKTITICCYKAAVALLNNNLRVPISKNYGETEEMSVTLMGTVVHYCPYCGAKIEVERP